MNAIDSAFCDRRNVWCAASAMTLIAILLVEGLRLRERFDGATAPRGSWSCRGEAAGEQREDRIVRATRREGEADASGGRDDAGGDLD